jgi:hypothetical protein
LGLLFLLPPARYSQRSGKAGAADPINRSGHFATKGPTGMNAVRTIRLWVNAFIPSHIPGYTTDIPSGPLQGQTMLLGPPGPPGSFLTDQRQFANSIDAAAQMHSHACLTFPAGKPKLVQWHQCQFASELRADDDQHELRPETSEESLDEPSDISRMNFTLLPHPSLIHDAETQRLISSLSRPDRTTDESRIHLMVDCSSRFPSDKLAEHFGDVTCRGVAQIDLEAKTVEFNGKVGRFPAYEMYLSINDAPGIPVFRLSPPRGAETLNRAGAALRVMRGTATFNV